MEIQCLDRPPAPDAGSLNISKLVFADMRALEVPSREQEKDAGRILKAARQGTLPPGMCEDDVTEARRLLVEHNMRWVVSVALGIKRTSSTLLDENELIAAGLYGAALAADLFDPDRGVRFITYATPAIRQKILLAIALDESIRRPEAHRKLTHAALKISRQLSQELGRPPSKAEICARIPGVKEEALLAMLQARLRPLSLNSSVSPEEDGDELLDLIADSRDCDPLENLIKEDFKDKVRKSLELLPEDQRSALSYRFGISCSGEELPVLQVSQIAAVMDINQEEVRRLIARGLAILKCSPVLESLNGA